MSLPRGRHPSQARWSPRGDLAPPTGYPALVGVGLGPDGLPVGLWSSAAGARAAVGRDDVGPHAPSFPRTRPSAPYAVALTRHTATGSIEHVVRVEALDVALPYLQPLPDGEFAVVGARAWWREGGPEHNAMVFTPQGELRLTGCLGDGINHLQVDAQGRLWAGYFDEGVYGNFGWGGAGPSPLGAPGLVAWSPSLTVDWALDSTEATIDDCYALNVGPDAVWACTYADFPVLRIGGAACAVTATRGVAGPWGILGQGDRVALLGTYDDRSLGVVASIEGGYAEQRRFSLVGPPGFSWSDARLHCRGAVAHAFVGSRWYATSLDDLASG